jgi:prepilin signal peptidase PulO-like enzyme (type II secretory pathway)
MSFGVAAAAAPGGAAVGWFAAPLTAAYCGPPTRPRRGVLAALTAATFAVAGWRFGAHADLAAYLYLSAVGPMLAVVDVRVRRLPDLLTLPSYGIGAALLAVAVPFVDGGGTRFRNAVIGLALLWFIYAAQHFVWPDAVGRGDVKLSGVLGLYLGWLGLDGWVTGALATFFIGGAYALGLIAFRRGSRKSEMPYGPFMLAGALLGIIAG